MKFIRVFFIVIIFMKITISYAEKLSKIVIIGNQRIDNETIISYLNIDKGQDINISDLNFSLKELFATDLFSKITYEYNKNTLFVKVKENPIINRIALEGNKRIKDDDILPEILLKPRDIFTLNKIKNNLQIILGLYRANGRYGAEVEPKVIYLEQNRVDLVFEIEEGPKSKIKYISFLGNSFFSDKRLKSEIMTKESRWWKILSSGGKFTSSLNTVLSCISIIPESGFSKPANNLSAVVFPEPETPRIPNIEPFQTSKLKSVRTTSSP